MRLASDLVVVGSGSAGAVIAARVSERADREVCLLEAGPDYPDASALPPDLVDGTRNSWRQHDWGYKAVPTPGQTIPFVFPRGKVVGGSSAVNTCIAMRPQPYDLDEWDLPEWRFDVCLPYLNRLEDDRDFDGPFHGKGGPIPIRRHGPDELVPWQAAFVEACRALGHPACEDINDPRTQGGVGPHAMNKIEGVRFSAARGYLTPAVRSRANLRIRAGTLVRRVIVVNRRVEAVEVEIAAGVEQIAARKVVLCAGAVATPGILLRSGIGPPLEIARLGVELCSDVPAVGARLLDHPGAAFILAARIGVSSLTHPLIQTVVRYTSRGSSCPNDMQVQPGSFLPLHPRVVLPTVTMMCSVGKPRGHGRIVFPSADARSSPRIFSEMLVHPDDHTRAVNALQLAYDCVRSSSMRTLAFFFWPGERVLRDRAALGEWIYRSCGSGYHPCGTVPMGRDGDVRAAVDARGRVRGVEGLVVADASIMPTVPSANTNLTTLLIGERFGEWLRDEAI